MIQLLLLAVGAQGAVKDAGSAFAFHLSGCRHSSGRPDYAGFR